MYVLLCLTEPGWGFWRIPCRHFLFPIALWIPLKNRRKIWMRTWLISRCFLEQRMSGTDLSWVRVFSCSCVWQSWQVLPLYFNIRITRLWTIWTETSLCRYSFVFAETGMLWTVPHIRHKWMGRCIWSGFTVSLADCSTWSRGMSRCRRCGMRSCRRIRSSMVLSRVFRRKSELCGQYLIEISVQSSHQTEVPDCDDCGRSLGIQVIVESLLPQRLSEVVVFEVGNGSVGNEEWLLEQFDIVAIDDDLFVGEHRRWCIGLG